MIDERLKAHPKVKKEAERRARELWAVQAPLFVAAGFDTVEEPEEAPEGFAITVDAQAMLLADVERPEARDWLVRSGLKADKRWTPYHTSYLHQWAGGTIVDEWLTLGVDGKMKFKYGSEKDAINHGIRNMGIYWNVLRDGVGLVDEWLGVMA